MFTLPQEVAMCIHPNRMNTSEMGKNIGIFKLKNAFIYH